MILPQKCFVSTNINIIIFLYIYYMYMQHVSDKVTVVILWIWRLNEPLVFKLTSSLVVSYCRTGAREEGRIYSLHFRAQKPKHIQRTPQT